MSNEAKVGLFVVAALAIFTVTFLSVATIQLSGERIEYKTFFKYAGGLDKGASVRFGGLQAGVITDVGPAPDDPTLARVVFEVRSNVPVNEESFATISSLNALGDNYLEITPGTKEAALIPPGGTVESREAVTFSDLTVKISEITDTAQDLMVEVQGDVELLIGDLRTLTQGLQEFTSEKNQRNIESLLENANDMIEMQAPKMDHITDQVSELLVKVDGTVDRLNTVAETADVTVRNVNRTVEETREPIKRDLAELEAALSEAREMLEEVNALVLSNQSNIDQTIENFRNTSENLEQFSDELRQRPWSLLRAKPKPDRQVPAQ